MRARPKKKKRAAGETEAKLKSRPTKGVERQDENGPLGIPPPVESEFPKTERENTLRTPAV